MMQFKGMKTLKLVMTCTKLEMDVKQEAIRHQIHSEIERWYLDSSKIFE